MDIEPILFVILAIFIVFIVTMVIAGRRAEKVL